MATPDDSRDPRDESWDERIFAIVPPGVDESIVDENLRLTPTERLEKMQRVLVFIADVKRATRGGLSRPR